MNHALRYISAPDLRAPWPSVSPVDSSSFIGQFSSDRLKAFKTRFSPSSESFGQKFANFAVTAGIYGVVFAAFRALSTANVGPILHALHLNVV